MIFENPLRVELDHHRWYTKMTVVHNEVTEPEVFYFSSDSALADSGLWFGTEEEYNEASEW